MASIAVIGTGYVGLVSGACLADFGNSVICADNNAEKIKSLNKGGIPIFEPGLDAVVDRNAKAGRLKFTTDLAYAVRESTVIFIAVGTPPSEDGSADLEYVKAAAKEIAAAMDDYRVIVNKSTVPVGTARKVAAWIGCELKRCGKGDVPFDIVSNPEFLREGCAVQDFTHPDRVLIGSESERALSIMKEVYRALYLNETPFIETNLETAEMIKYAANSFLAVKIAFINEIAALCEKTGANVQDVAKAMGRDTRIGAKFLHPGPGYGGSCFPKDTRAIAATGREAGAALSIVEAAIAANDGQKLRMVEKIKKAVSCHENARLDGKTIAVLGLSFKPNTDDMRESAAIPIILELAKAGARIRACDPAALKEATWRLADAGDAVTLFSCEYEAAEGADALVIMTEWNQYRSLDFERLKNLMKNRAFIDLRNVYSRAEIEAKGFSYTGVGV